MSKGRKESTLSLILERSMNMFCRVLTYDELIQYQKLLDEQDDAEHKKMEGLFIEKRSMERHFKKQIDMIINNGGNLKELQKEMLQFQESYERRLKKIMDIRRHLEDEDDRVREQLLSHTNKCQKRLREESSRIEQSLIQENMNKKLAFGG